MRRALFVPPESLFSLVRRTFWPRRGVGADRAHFFRRGTLRQRLAAPHLLTHRLAFLIYPPLHQAIATWPHPAQFPSAIFMHDVGAAWATAARSPSPRPPSRPTSPPTPNPSPPKKTARSGRSQRPHPLRNFASCVSTDDPYGPTHLSS